MDSGEVIAMRVFAIYGLVTLLGAGCSDELVVGESCETDVECEGLDEGYCPAAGVCTRECSAHSDCGCAGGTSNADLAGGGCDAACVDFGDGALVCVRACDGQGQCEGMTTCRELGLAYRICL